MDRYHRRQVWEALEDLQLPEVEPRQRRMFPLIWRHLVTEHEARLRWTRRTAWIAGAAGALGASFGPDLAHWLESWVRTL